MTPVRIRLERRIRLVREPHIHAEAVARRYAGENCNFVLVEFKRTSAQLRDDHGKYHNFEDARKSLSDRSKHHFFVYGALDEQSTVVSRAVAYFAEKPEEAPTIPLDEVFANAASKEVFDEYLEELFELRKDDKRGSGDYSLEDTALVMGLTVDSVVGTLSLGDYINQFRLVPEPESKAGQEGIRPGKPPGFR